MTRTDVTDPSIGDELTAVVMWPNGDKDMEPCGELGHRKVYFRYEDDYVPDRREVVEGVVANVTDDVIVLLPD